MGTKGSCTGGGGSAGGDLRDEITNWLDAPPPSPPKDDQEPPDQPPPDERPERPPLPPESLLPTIGLFRPRPSGGGDGPGGIGGGGRGRPDGGAGGGGRGGGAERTTARASSRAGRAAAAAYALRTGNAAVLAELGLDYDQLRASDDPIDVTRQIVSAACGPLPDGTIEDDEERRAAAETAQWVLEANEGGAPPDPSEIVREAIATIIFEAATTETAATLRNSDHSVEITLETERQMRNTAHVLADRAELTATGPTPSELERAIEQGIETLRAIWKTE